MNPAAKKIRKKITQAGAASPPAGAGIFKLRLYVAGQTLRCLAALTNLERICEKHLQGRCRIEVIDLLESPQRAREDEIFAVPTLVRDLPTYRKRIIGDLSNTEKVLEGLGIQAGYIASPAPAEAAAPTGSPSPGRHRTRRA